MRIASYCLLLLLSAPALAAPPVAIEANRLRAHVAFLADDLLEGRRPGTRGGQLAEKYVAAQMAVLGLRPAGENGTYFQKVPLVGVTTKPTTTLSFRAKGEPIAAKLNEDVVFWTDAQKEVVDAASELVFAGYGVVAPEYRWDDFKGVDVKGKILLLLVNDPPATADEPDLFKGKALTYYGRWTYKFESAARRGAIGALLVHTDESAGYGWEVVRNSWSGEKSQNRLDAAGPAPLLAAGWLSREIVSKILERSGTSFEKLKAAAARRDFTPVPLGVTASAHLESALRPFEANNVAGSIPGTDAARKDETVIFTAHLDHFGIGEPDETGDRIYNGALDDASGVASMLEVARAAALEGGWPRGALFLAVTAEEQGLKGSAWYASHPMVPPGKTAADVNLDGGHSFGEVDDLVVMGSERSPELEAVADAVARSMSFRITPDEHPELGYFYRSDHFSLARVGIPCLNLVMGESLRGKPAGTGGRLENEYRQKRYHRPADQLDGAWDFAGLVQYATVAKELGGRVAGLPTLPNWKPGDEFKAARDASLARK